MHGILIQVGMKQCGIESAQTSSDYRVQTYIPVKFSIDEEHQVIYFDDDNEVHEELEEGISDFIELARRVKHLDMITTASTKYQVKKKSLEKKPPTTGKTPVRSVADLS
jgi:predicted alpha/beta superfamily hydrolase